MDRFPSARVGVGCALLAALVGVAGCGIKRIPTNGKVTLDGQPMTEGVLQFIPDASKGNNLRVGCSGPISNGRWSLATTGMERADTGAGAPVGWFKVTYDRSAACRGLHDRVDQQVGRPCPPDTLTGSPGAAAD
jgi:hypothetical protein